MWSGPAVLPLDPPMFFELTDRYTSKYKYDRDARKPDFVPCEKQRTLILHVRRLPCGDAYLNL